MTNPSRLFTVLSLLLSAAACSEGDGVGPTAPEEIETESVYSLSITLTEFEASSAEACDGRALFGGAPLDGEFHYRVEVEHGSDVSVFESRDYGSVFGRAYQLSPGENLDFGDRTYDFVGLEEGETVNLRLRATEWDGPAKDGDLNDRTTVASYTTGNTVIGSNRTDLLVGSETCGLRLHYDYQVAVEQVPVG